MNFDNIMKIVNNEKYLYIFVFATFLTTRLSYKSFYSTPVMHIIGSSIGTYISTGVITFIVPSEYLNFVNIPLSFISIIQTIRGLSNLINNSLIDDKKIAESSVSIEMN